MGRKAANVPNKNRLALSILAGFMWLLCGSLTSPASQPGSSDSSFTDRTASALLGHIASGLRAHNPDRMLGAFDIGKMADGPLFKQQVTSLFDQTVTIRVHFNQIQTTAADGKGMATVTVEMEAERSDDRIPPLRKHEQLSLTAENSSGTWKFTDVQPRSFFSIQP